MHLCSSMNLHGKAGADARHSFVSRKTTQRIFSTIKSMFMYIFCIPLSNVLTHPAHAQLLLFLALHPFSYAPVIAE